MLLICLKKQKPPCDWYNVCIVCGKGEINKRQICRCSWQELSKPQKVVGKSHKYMKKKNLCMDRSAYNTQVLCDSLRAQRAARTHEAVVDAQLTPR